MSLLQALLIGLFAYMGSKRTPWFFGVTGGWNMLGRPLVAGLIVGLILGDVRNGVIAGAMVQALFIGQITPGGAMPADVNWAAYIGIPLALAAGGTGEQAVALAVPLSMLGLGLFNFIMTINAYFPHMGDKAAEKGDGAGIHRATYLAAVPSFILRAGSAMLICYLGTPLAELLINGMPTGVLHFFEVAGKLLPAIGFAMLLKQSLSKRWMLVLFLLGWIMIGATSMSVTALAIFATALAFIFVMAQDDTRFVAPAAVSQNVEEDDCYEE
jgi:PTS system mannose-specific IIC component